MTTSHEPVTARIAESSWRLKALIDQVYYWYMNQGLRMDSQGGTGTLYFPPSTEEVLRYVRYFVLELQDFVGLYERNFDTIMSRQLYPDPQKLYTILEGQHDTARFVRDLGRDLGTGSAIALDDMASRVNTKRFEDILIYTRLVIEFQDEIIKSDKGSPIEMSVDLWDKILAQLSPRTDSDASELTMRYRDMSVLIDVEPHIGTYSNMYRLCKGMMMLQDMLNRSIVEFKNNPMGKVMPLTVAGYMIKYMIIDLRNFLELCNKLELSPSIGFSSRYETYRELQDQWSANIDAKEGSSMRRLLYERPTIISYICDDIDEARLIMSRIDGEFMGKCAIPDSPVYEPNFAAIDTRLNSARKKVICRPRAKPENDEQAEELMTKLKKIVSGGLDE